MKQPDRLADLYHEYDIFFCDVWGVLHNGVAVYPLALTALEQARRVGKFVFLITNSPRLQAGVAAQLKAFGILSSCYDGIVTSGDVTLNMIKETPQRIFHIGPDRDLCLYDSFDDVELVGEFTASAVVCTGLFNNENETPVDYQHLLYRLRTRNLPFVCVNPDVIVQKGDKILWCSGALARIYAQFGGQILISGKPYRPIYDVTCKIISDMIGKPIDKSRVLAIGDGMATDVKGAHLYGLDVLFIGAGIHANEYAVNGAIINDKLDTFIENCDLKPTAFMMYLR